jgi:NAD+ synthase
MQPSKRIDYIKNWINDYCKSMSKEPDSLVIGISGGIDSSVTSAICALTGKKTIVLSLPIKQIKAQQELSLKHQEWLKSKFKNIESHLVILDNVFKSFKNSLSEFHSEHGLANSRARLRMVALYQAAASNNGIVVGTGNKIEDFGVGFYTKYGDGGVDISPIADCTKSQIWEMGKNLGILEEIIKAEPTDGLWDDGRTDVKQLGMSYQELEVAMEDSSNKNHKKYLEIRKRNLHKMNPVPVCKMKDE